MNPASTIGSAPERRSPSTAAFLSFLWPGLGHLYTRRIRAAILFAAPLVGVLLIVAAQAADGIGELAALFISPSSALTIAILIVLLGVWREIALIDSALAIRPRGTWRRRQSLAVIALATLIIAVTHLWAGSIAWAFYDAGQKIFVGPEGADVAVVSASTSSPDPSASPDLDDDFVAAPFAIPATPTARVNILLTGVDSAETRSHELTDTLIVASIDPSTSDVALISFPRDITDFPLVDGRTFTGKIDEFMTWVRNHPKDFKDPPLTALVKELSFLVGAPIHYYAAVDLAGFRRLIDAAGGVTVDVERAIDDPLYDWLDGRRGFKLSAGPHALDGDHALAFVRARNATGDDDFDRAHRQQQVLLALADKLSTPAMLTRIPNLIDVAGDTLRTNFPSGRVSEMLGLVPRVDGASVKQVVLGEPYSFHPPDGSDGLRLRMDKLAALSREIFGSESRYHQP